MATGFLHFPDLTPLPRKGKTDAEWIAKRVATYLRIAAKS
jgi:hypothetical protein